MAAGDLFAIEVMTLTGLVRYMVFFVMELKSRRVHVAGVAVDPNGRWMEQMAAISKKSETERRGVHRYDWAT